jgi:excinuclease ABC subunit A
MLRIQGARTHNLKNIDLELPRERFIVVTGLSGSGKSSLAFDTIFAEGQRRYVESLSAYARQFLSVMEKPDVDHIEGLSPAIAIEQKATSHNPRSTVGTVTEIHDYLRLLYARAGEPHCPRHDVSLAAQTVSQMVDTVLQQGQDARLMLLAPLVCGRKGEHREVIDAMRAQGFIRLRLDGIVYDIEDLPAIDGAMAHDIDVVVDRFRARGDIALRLSESFETALALAEDRAIVESLDDDQPLILQFSARFACPHCDYTVPELEPRLFSFNNPTGACPACDGLGSVSFFDEARIVARPDLSLPAGAIRGWDRRSAYYFQILQALASHYGFDLDTPWCELSERIRGILLFGSGDDPVTFAFRSDKGRRYSKSHPFEGIIPNMERRYRETESSVIREELSKNRSIRPCLECHGTRLNEAARHVLVDGFSLPELESVPIGDTARRLLEMKLDGWRADVASSIINELSKRLRFLLDVGLDYLSLDRASDSLSGGEAQRIRLASQIGAGLVGVTYILDEPSIGLHQRDNRRLLDSLVRLRDMGNTVIVVEHDEEAIMEADVVVDMGPGAGENGGQVVAHGRPEDVAREPASLTGQYLSGKRKIAIPAMRRPVQKESIDIYGARGNNLDNVDVSIPLGVLVCVTGVSGSGKSTLVNDTLHRSLARHFGLAVADPAPAERIEGLANVDKIVAIDQGPIGRTPRSNPATYTGLFAPLRDIFASTQEARSRGYSPGRFSFNVKGGRCEACRGDGLIKVEMHFLADIYVTCDQCRGRRYNRETLEIRYRGLSIDEVLNLSVVEALELFNAIPVVSRKLQTLVDVGLGYIRLGQSATTLSGGEAQRIKLARELSKRDSGRTLYILDEPTTGLHFYDIEQLLRVLERLVDRGNTVVVIEHNLDVIKSADWVIDLGPEGGRGGGQLVVAGTPEDVARHPTSYTGQFLDRWLTALNGRATDQSAKATI